jgi:hypothetical protein
MLRLDQDTETNHECDYPSISMSHRVLTRVKTVALVAGFAESREEELGQAAKVGLFDRFRTREGAQFPINEPPAGDRKNANSAW